jgi:hypothetical protein
MVPSEYSSVPPVLAVTVHVLNLTASEVSIAMHTHIFDENWQWTW